MHIAFRASFQTHSFGSRSFQNLYLIILCCLPLFVLDFKLIPEAFTIKYTMISPQAIWKIEANLSESCGAGIMWQRGQVMLYLVEQMTFILLKADDIGWHHLLEMGSWRVSRQICVHFGWHINGIVIVSGFSITLVLHINVSTNPIQVHDKFVQ